LKTAFGTPWGQYCYRRIYTQETSELERAGPGSSRCFATGVATRPY
jgi:hypothetical protein